MGIDQETLEQRMSGEVVSIESEFVKFSVSPENGCYYFLDKQSDTVWHSNPYAERMGQVMVRIGDESQGLPLRNLKAHKAGKTIDMSYCQQKGDTVVELGIKIELLPDGKTIEVSYKPENGTEIENIRLLGSWNASSHFS